MSSALRCEQDRRRRSWCVLPIASLIAIGVVFLPGCASYVHTPYVPAAVPFLAQPIAAGGTAFDYHVRRHPAATLVELEGNAGDYQTWSLEMASSGAADSDRRPIKARYDEGKAAGAKPLVVVLPVWGVSAYPSETIAASLRAQGDGAINVLQVDGDRMLFDWATMADAPSEAEFHRRLALMVERFVDAVIDIRRLIDWAYTRPEIDTQRIALIGFSMSAIVGSVALTNDPRINAGVLVVGGADLHEVLASCNGRIRRTRERILDRFGWSIEDYKEQLRVPLAPINPARFAGRLDPDRVLIIEAAADTCIPQSARERFWDAMGRPERIAYEYGHRATFLAMTFLGGYDLQRQIHRFLDRTIAPRLVRYESAQNDPSLR
jgi:dienelactone hydrolase